MDFSGINKGTQAIVLDEFYPGTLSQSTLNAMTAPGYTFTCKYAMNVRFEGGFSPMIIVLSEYCINCAFPAGKNDSIVNRFV